VTAAVTSGFTLTDDELQVVGERAGVQGFPTVLDVRPRYERVDTLEAASTRPTAASSHAD